MTHPLFIVRMSSLSKDCGHSQNKLLMLHAHRAVRTIIWAARRTGMVVPYGRILGLFMSLLLLLLLFLGAARLLPHPPTHINPLHLL